MLHREMATNEKERTMDKIICVGILIGLTLICIGLILVTG
jgi:hypothetical protein